MHHMPSTIHVFSSFTYMYISRVGMRAKVSLHMSEAAVGSSCRWYGGFTILVTLVWLYTEVLKVLSILNSNRED